MLDRHSPAVSKLIADIETEIVRLHGTLERIGKPPEEYDVARGQIRGLRWALTQIVDDKEDTLSNG